MIDTKQSEEQADNLSRRGLFNILGAVPAIAAVTAGSVVAQSHEGHQHGGETQGAQAKGPYQRQTFDDHQWKTVRVLCDLIVPADNRSGSASDAGVPEFLDDWVAFRTDQDGNQDFKATILGGLMWLDRESNHLFQSDFADTSANNQRQLLDRIAYPKKAAKADMAWVRFFSVYRSLTVSGFFSSKVGVKDLPYLGNTAVAEWKGCDPEVWAVIEKRMKHGYTDGIVESKPWSSAS